MISISKRPIPCASFAMSQLAKSAAKEDEEIEDPRDNFQTQVGIPMGSI